MLTDTVCNLLEACIKTADSHGHADFVKYAKGMVDDVRNDETFKAIDEDYTLTPLAFRMLVQRLYDLSRFVDRVL